MILPESRSLSNYALLVVDISIIEKFIQDKSRIIIRNSKEEEKFVSKLINIIRNINTSNISSKELLKEVVQEYTRTSDSIWYKFSKNVNITKCSKAWWNEECNTNLNRYQFSKTLKNWKNFKRIIKKTKYIFFDKKIQKIILKNKRL